MSEPEKSPAKLLIVNALREKANMSPPQESSLWGAAAVTIEDQQALIKQLVGACERAWDKLMELGQSESTRTLQILDAALAAAEKMEAKNGKDSL